MTAFTHLKAFSVIKRKTMRNEQIATNDFLNNSISLVFFPSKSSIYLWLDYLVGSLLNADYYLAHHLALVLVLSRMNAGLCI